MKTTSLELSKRLKEAGVSQQKESFSLNSAAYKYDSAKVDIRAFTSDELLELLPGKLKYGFRNLCLRISWEPVGSEWVVDYLGMNRPIYNKSLPEALGQLLLRCIAEGYVEVKK